MSEGLPTRVLNHLLALWDSAPPPDYIMNKANAHIALCVGHSRRINGHPEGGAVSHDGKTNEWNHNLPLAILIRARLKQHGIRATILSEYQGGSYDSAQRWLAGHLKSLGITHAIELHFNSSDTPAATGHEWLHHHASARGKSLASRLSREVTAALPLLPVRGVKPRYPASNRPDNRGWQFTTYPHCPSVICEPGFASNPSDWQILRDRKETLADAIARALVTETSAGHD